MKQLKIKTYDEITNLNKNTVKQYTFKKGTLKKEYEFYFIKTEGYFGIVLFVFKNDKLLYTDSQLHYTYIKEETETIKKMLQVAKYKIFSVEELNKIKNYSDYKEKNYFICNTYKKIFNHISMFSKDNNTKYKYYSNIGFSKYEKIEDVEHLRNLVNTLNNEHDNKIKNDIEYFKNAVKYEFDNYEVVYGGRFEEAFEAIGIYNYEEKLTDEQKIQIEKIYNKLIMRT